MPTIAELRTVTQPPSIFARDSGEHWAGRLYIRRFSPYLTRLLLRTPITPNGVTMLMLFVGAAAAGVLALDGVVPAVGAFMLIQLQILLDCSDGELARWKDMRSPAGVYLDRAAHWVTESLLPIALGIRADEPVLGLSLAVLVLWIKGESALVTVARAECGLPPAADTREVSTPRAGGLRALRRAAGRLPFFRAFVAMEFTLLALVASFFEDGSRWLVIGLIPLAAVTALGHLVAILASGRLR
jgi:phosphatidylglycerophosphate synthase